MNARLCTIQQPAFYSPEFCESLIERCEEKNAWREADLENGVHRSQDRNTYICEAGEIDPTGEFLVPPIQDFLSNIYAYNESSWKFVLHRNALELTFLKYKVGNHYNAWHTDVSNEASMRKISFSIQLSGGEDYEGGDLIFLDKNMPTTRRQGSAVIFPSFLAHKVTPVTKGVRYALIGWLIGPPFK